MIDASIINNLRPVQIEDPSTMLAKGLALRGQIQQQQLGAQELQQRQVAIDQTKALNDAYKGALTVGPDGTASIDSGKLTNALGASGHGSAIPGVLKSVNEFQQAAANLAKTKGEVTEKLQDLGGSLGSTVKAANNDPHLFLTMAQHAIESGAIDKQMGGEYVQHVQQLLAADPTGEQARQAVGQISDQLIARSPGQQKILSEKMTAEARKSQADTSASIAPTTIARNTAETANLTAELAGNQAKSEMGQRMSDASKLAAAAKQGPAALQAALSTLPSDRAKVFEGLTDPTAIARMGMTADQQVTTDQAAANAKETARHNRIEENQGASRVGVEQGRLAVERRNGGLDEHGQPIQYTDPQTGQAVNIDPLARQIAAYKMPPVSARSYNSNRGLMQQVLAVNPGFDIGQYEQRYTTMKDLAPNGKVGQQALALNTLIRHSDDLLDAIGALGNGNFTPANAGYQKLRQLFGDSAPTTFDQLKQFVAGETVKLVRGGGGTAEDEKNASANISRAGSPQQLVDALKTNFGVAGGKLQALNESVRRAIGDDKYTAVDQGASQILQRRGFDLNTMKPATGGGTNAKATFKVGDTVMYNGAAHKVTGVKPDGKLILDGNQ